MTSYDETHKPLHTIALLGGQYPAARWYQIFDDGSYIISGGFTGTYYSAGPGGAEAFIHDLKQLVGAHDV